MKFWSILNLSYKHQLHESGIYITYSRSDIEMIQKPVPHLTKKWEVFSAEQNVCEIPNQNWTMLNI